MAHRKEEDKKEYMVKYRENHKEEIKTCQKRYNENHQKEREEYYNKNREKILNQNKEYNKQIKIQALNILGSCNCIICGNINLNYLTVDHIDKTGSLDRKNIINGKNFYSFLSNGLYPAEKLSNLRILCYNCNCGRRKEYLTVSYELQTIQQRYQTKLWKQAFEFFGPCKTCGDTNLVHLTISHIHNDGAERRKNGEKFGVNLLAEFRKQGWPESLKEDYCLECYNCNCSRKFIDKTP